MEIRDACSRKHRESKHIFNTRIIQISSQFQFTENLLVHSSFINFVLSLILARHIMSRQRLSGSHPYWNYRVVCYLNWGTMMTIWPSVVVTRTTTTACMTAIRMGWGRRVRIKTRRRYGHHPVCFSRSQFLSLSATVLLQPELVILGAA